MHRTSRRPGVGPSTMTGLCVLLVLADVSVVSRTGVGLTVLACGVLALASAVAQARMHRTGRSVLACALALLAATASLLTTSLLQSTVLQRTPGWAELCGLLASLCLVCRYARPTLLVVSALPLFAAVVRTQERAPVLLELPVLKDVDGLFVLLPTGFVLLGGYLRGEDARRRAAARDMRRAERLDLARDLHDHVAHYVTAMVVQAQAGEQTAERDPTTAQALFSNIERTGQEGLVAMSRMVGLLRTEGQGPREPTVTPVLTSIGELVRRADSAQQPTTLEIADEVNADVWPPQLAKTVHRLVQEGLTNVRKHARTATAVQVRLGVEADRLVVRVRDDATGQPRGRLRFRPSGFGMVGLEERITELGGQLSSGPLPEGGWELAASIPMK
ncbi:sensor histidine kinase [Streptomyces tendae]|uniref:sensor histidine kinase n=1 Tax=Streptomyces tendae TaxID=1932 RepID=UPI0037913E2A